MKKYLTWPGLTIDSNFKYFRSRVSSQADVEDVLQVTLIDDDRFVEEDIEDSQGPSQVEVEIDHDLVDLEEPIEKVEVNYLLL